LLTQSFILHNEVEAFPWVMMWKSSNIWHSEMQFDC
jgi:hypothetical protein